METLERGLVRLSRAAEFRQCMRRNCQTVSKDHNAYRVEKLLFAAERQANPILHHTIGLVASAGASTQDMSSHALRYHRARLSLDGLRVEKVNLHQTLVGSAFKAQRVPHLCRARSQGTWKTFWKTMSSVCTGWRPPSQPQKSEHNHTAQKGIVGGKSEQHWQKLGVCRYLVAIGGSPGSGKTSAADLACKLLNKMGKGQGSIPLAVAVSMDGMSMQRTM